MTCEGMSFAEVIRSLQLRLDLPELELFDVQADRVLLRAAGRRHPDRGAIDPSGATGGDRRAGGVPRPPPRPRRRRPRPAPA